MDIRFREYGVILARRVIPAEAGIDVSQRIPET